MGETLRVASPAVAAAVLGLPTKSCIIDGELIAAGRHGQPDFLALLHGRHVPTCVYCFDLLQLNGRDLREQPLVQRRARLQALLARAKCNVIRFSEGFPDASALLAECGRLGLEGIVAKRKDSPYRLGTRSGWIKVKTPKWKAANQYREKLFEKRGRANEPGASSSMPGRSEPSLRLRLLQAGLLPTCRDREL
jgi:ATP-dependent DNA ligase